MKKIILPMIAVLFSAIAISQTNTFPDSGNVGIGTTVPSEKLEVIGNIKTTGNIQVGGNITVGTVNTGSVTADTLRATQLRADSFLRVANSIIIDGVNDKITSTSGNINFGNNNLTTGGNISAGTIQTNQLVIDTILATDRIAVNNSLFFERQNTNNYAEVSTTNSSIDLILQSSTLSRVGIGTTAPTEKLTVIGNAAISGNVKVSGKISASAFTSNSPLIFEAPTGIERARIDDVTGNMGIGTPNPNALYKLDVNGDINANQYFINGQPFAGEWQLNGNDLYNTNTGNVGIGTIPNTLSNIQGNYKVDVNGDFRIITSGGTGGGNVIVKTDVDNGNIEAKVGIGTENPVRALHIYTEHIVSLPPCPTCAGSHNGMRLEDLSGSGQPIRSIWDIMPVGGAVSGSLIFSKGDPNNDNAVDAKMMIAGNGDVGIGTISPQHKFHVFGKGKFEDGSGSGVNIGFNSVNSFVYSEGTGALMINYHSDKDVVIGQTQTSNLSVNSTTTIGHDTYLATSSGSVGIGTNTPIEKLDVAGSALVYGKLGIGLTTPVTAQEKLQIGNAFAFHDGGNKIIFKNGYFNGTTDVRLESGFANAIRFNNTGDMIIQASGTLPGPANGQINWIDAVAVKTDGKVGIGNASPYKKLTVQGDVSFVNYDVNNNYQVLNSFEILGNNSIPTRRGIAVDNDPNGSFNLYIHSFQSSSSFNFKNGNGNVTLMTIGANGQVQIGTQKPTAPFTNYKLSVDGSILAKEVHINLNTWADDELKKDLTLDSLQNDEAFVLMFGYLNGVPSEKEVETNGIDLGQMGSLQIRKIERLYKYAFLLRKENEMLKKKYSDLEKRIELLEKK